MSVCRDMVAVGVLVLFQHNNLLLRSIDIQLEADGMFYSQISKNTAIIRNYFSEIFTKRIHHISEDMVNSL